MTYTDITNQNRLVPVALIKSLKNVPGRSNVFVFKREAFGLAGALKRNSQRKVMPEPPCMQAAREVVAATIDRLAWQQGSQAGLAS